MDLKELMMRHGSKVNLTIRVGGEDFEFTLDFCLT